MAIYETRTADRPLPRSSSAHAPALTPLEVAALAIAVIMALGPLTAYAVGLGL